MLMRSRRQQSGREAPCQRLCTCTGSQHLVHLVHQVRHIAIRVDRDSFQLRRRLAPPIGVQFRNDLLWIRDAIILSISQRYRRAGGKFPRGSNANQPAFLKWQMQSPVRSFLHKRSLEIRGRHLRPTARLNSADDLMSHGINSQR